MSDCCWFSMSILKADRDKATGIMFGKEWTEYTWSGEDDNKDGTVTLVEYDADYGYMDRREKLAEARVPFEGQYGPGGEYGEAVFASHGGQHVDVVAVDGLPVVIVYEDGEVDKAGLETAREYYLVLKRAQEYFSEG